MGANKAHIAHPPGGPEPAAEEPVEPRPSEPCGELQTGSELP
jgi:hypothetical protein